MEKITCNKGNWSGEQITVNVRKDGSFDLFGYKFQLKSERRAGEDMVHYTLTGDQWQEPVARGYKVDGEKYTVMYDGDLQREDENPHVAAIQLLCNIL